MISNNYNLNKELSDLKNVNGFIIDGSFVPIKEGYCEIVALTNENDNYLATFSNKIMVRITKTDQEKLIITKNSNLYFLGSTQLITLGGNSDYEPIYTVITPHELEKWAKQLKIVALGRVSSSFASGKRKTCLVLSLSRDLLSRPSCFVRVW
jgi:hypothetical protein